MRSGSSQSREEHNTKKQGIECVLRNTKWSLLLVGITRCGHGGSTQTTTWNTKKFPQENGM